MPSDSAVLELQRLAQSGSTDIAELLRKAKVVAVKLGLRDSALWLDHELNGYAPDADLPEYRVVPCQLHAHNPFHGWHPVVWEEDDWLSQYFSKIENRDSLSQIQHLVVHSKGTLHASLSPSETSVLIQCSEKFERVSTAKFLSAASLAAILDGVRNRILDWALELEQQGVLGDGMTFSPEEKTDAASVTINYGPVVHGDNAQIASAQDSPGANVSAAGAQATVSQRIEKAIKKVGKADDKLAEGLGSIAEAIEKSSSLPAEQRTAATEQLSFIADQCALAPERRQPASVTAKVVVGLRDTLAVGADVLTVWGTFAPVIAAALGLHL